MSEPASTTLAGATPVPAWMSSSVASIAKMLGAGFSFSVEDGLEVDPLLPDDRLRDVAKLLQTTRDRMACVSALYDRVLGHIILEYAARHSCSNADAVDALGLCEKMGMVLRSFERLPRMVARNLPENFTLPGLVTTHFTSISDFAEPESPPEKRLWRQRCHEILKEASEDPKTRNPKWVKEKVRELQKEFGVVPKKKIPASMVMQQALVARIVLDTWNDDDFAARGITRGQITDRWEQFCAELVEREIIPDGSDRSAVVLPWTQRSTEAVTIQAETEETEDDEDEDTSKDAAEVEDEDTSKDAAEVEDEDTSKDAAA